MARIFHNKVVWITGGGSGIGRALALEFARSGARVAVSGRRREKLEDTVVEIKSAGGEGLAVTCDVTDEESIREAVAQVVSTWGGLDVAVANAGYAVNGRIEALEAEKLRHQLDTNVVGAAMTAKHALPALRLARGRMVFVSSVAGMVCYPGGGAYCASKFALRAIGMTLAQEAHGTGVSVTTFYPGFVESEIGQVDNAGVYHAERVDQRPKRIMWSSERAARLMMRAIGRRKRECVYTGHGKLLGWLGRHTPGLVHWAIALGAGRSATDRLGERKRP